MTTLWQAAATRRGRSHRAAIIAVLPRPASNRLGPRRPSLAPMVLHLAVRGALALCAGRSLRPRQPGAPTRLGTSRPRPAGSSTRRRRLCAGIGGLERARAPERSSQTAPHASRGPEDCEGVQRPHPGDGSRQRRRGSGGWSSGRRGRGRGTPDPPSQEAQATEGPVAQVEASAPRRQVQQPRDLRRLHGHELVPGGVPHLGRRSKRTRASRQALESPHVMLPDFMESMAQALRCRCTPPRVASSSTGTCFLCSAHGLASASCPR